MKIANYWMNSALYEFTEILLNEFSIIALKIVPKLWSKNKYIYWVRILKLKVLYEFSIGIWDWVNIHSKNWINSVKYWMNSVFNKI